MDNLINNTIDFLNSIATEKRKQFANNYHPTALKIIGVDSAGITKAVKQLEKEIKFLNYNDKLELIFKFLEYKIFELQLISFHITYNDKKIWQSINAQSIKKLGINLDNWVSVDTYSTLVLGYAWQLNIINSNYIKSLAENDDLWIKRTAIVSTISLNQKVRGGLGNADETLKIIKLTMCDHRDLINKAISWALRVLSTRDKVSVENFINENQNVLNSRVLREVRKKLITGKKN